MLDKELKSVDTFASNLASQLFGEQEPDHHPNAMNNILNNSDTTPLPFGMTEVAMLEEDDSKMNHQDMAMDEDDDEDMM
jgi:hypothetical protein